MRNLKIIITTPFYILWWLWVAACGTIIPMGGFCANGWLFGAWAVTVVGLVAYVRIKTPPRGKGLKP